MSFELVAVPGQGQKRPRIPPPVRSKPLDGSFRNETFEQLPESGPEHSHAPVYVPPGQPNSVFKEYDISFQNQAHEEAKRMNAASGYMPKVYGLYVDEPNQKVYIHMQKLKETVMARIEREGIDFLYEENEQKKFEALWETMKLYDGSSMCRVDNMMYDNENNLKFIDAEKAEFKTDGLSDDNKQSMKRCFLESATQAHLVYLSRNVDLYKMGNLYYRTGHLLQYSRWLSRNFTRDVGEALLQWFDEGYERHYLFLCDKGIAITKKLYEQYGVRTVRNYREISLSLRTPFIEPLTRSFERIYIRRPPTNAL